MSKKILPVVLAVALFFILSVLFFYPYLKNLFNTPSEAGKNPFSMLNKKSAQKVEVTKEEPVEDNRFSNVPKEFTRRFNAIECVIPEGAKDIGATFAAVPGIKPDATTVDDYWMLTGKQPVVLDYMSFGGNEFMVGAITDDEGKCLKMSFVLTGAFGLEDKSGMFNETKVKVDGNLVTVEEFKNKFPAGSQVVAYFLSKMPESLYLVPEFCDYLPPMSEYYCSLQRAHQRYSVAHIDAALRNSLSRFPFEREPVYLVNAGSIL